MKTAIETITPAQAKKYLQQNTENRKVRKVWVERLASMIKAGDWHLTHQGIAFSTDGRLIDGQHRLLAIVEANTPAQMMVAREIAEASYRHIDGGAPRVLADKLKLCNDVTLNRKLAALVRTRLAVIGGSAAAVSVDDAEEEFLAHDKAYLAVGRAWLRTIKGVTRTEIGAALVSYASHAMKKADQFGIQLLSGENLYKGLPSHTLREALIGGRAGQGFSETENYYKSIAAMKAHQEDRTLTTLQPATEDFQGNIYTQLMYRRKAISTAAAETRRKEKYK